MTVACLSRGEHDAMNGGLIVVQLGVDSFQQWVKEGVILLSRSFLASLPVAWSEAQEHADGDPNLFLIQLPEKYGRALSVGRSVYALIDEAKAISLPTRDLTLEWQSRMANLGEEWLPFQPKPEWVQVCTPEDLTGVYEKADYKSDSCEPDDSVVGEVSCTLSEPEQCSGCVENPASVTSAHSVIDGQAQCVMRQSENL